MRNGKWSQYFQISSNMAVLLGVLLVVFQLRQNAELLELQIIKQDSDSYASGALETIPENFDEIWHTAIVSPSDLSGADILTLDRYIWGRFINRWRGLYDLSELGLLDDSSWRRTVREDAGILDHPFGRAWWSGVKAWESTLPDELIVLIDEVLVTSPGDSQRDVIADTINRIAVELEQSQ